MKLSPLIFILSFLFVNAKAQNNEVLKAKGNLEIINSIVESDLDELQNRLTITGREKIYGFALRQDNYSKYFSLKLRQKLNNYRLIVGDQLDSAEAEIIFDNVRIKTEYLGYNTLNVLGDKRLDRKITVAYTIKLVDRKTSDILYTQDFIKTYTDNFLYDELSGVEDRNYAFANAKVPDQGFFGKYLVPIIVIAASAAAVILFFSIRSE